MTATVEQRTSPIAGLPLPTHWIDVLSAWANLPPRERSNVSPEALRNSGESFPMIRDGYILFVYKPDLSVPTAVSVVGDFNRWNPLAHPMTELLDTGIYVVAVPREDVGHTAGTRYKFAVLREGAYSKALDPLNPHISFEVGNELTETGNLFRDYWDGGRGDVNQVLRKHRLPISALIERPSPDRSSLQILRPDEYMAESALLPRNCYVYLPPGYHADPTRSYPVMIMNDGQNLFDDPIGPFGEGGWNLNKTVDALIRDGKMAPLILVGIENTSARRAEYSPAPASDPPGLDGTGPEYVDMIRDNLLPVLRRRFRILDGAANCAIGGSSLGALIAFWAALREPELFGKVACMSPSFWFEDEDGQTMFSYLDKVGRRPVKIYLDSGTAGRSHDGAPLTRMMRAWLQRHGWENGRDLMHIEQRGHQHNEPAWRERSPRMLQFLFPAA